MANTIVLKRSSTQGKVPTTAQLALGEIAINTFDGLIYIKKDDGTPSIVQIGGVTSVNGETGAVTIDTGDVAENGNLYFTNARARAAVSAGTGISYNSSTGVISTAQNLSTAGSPTFAGLTLTGDIIPNLDNTYSLGSADKMWRDVYVGPGSLYVNGQKVLQDDSGTITVSADADQTLQLKTSGSGNVQVTTGVGAVFQVNATMQIASGYNITDSAGSQVQFGDNIQMNSNRVVGLGTPSASTDAATKGYVDTSISAISTSSISQGNSNVTVTDTGTGTVTVSVDGSTALTVTSTGVTVAGNLTVSGATTTVESNTISLADNIITLNSDTTGSASQNAGVEVERGDDTNVSLRWNEGSDIWTFTNDGAVYHPMAVSTSDLTEGTNQYFTTARARGALSASTATGVSFNSSTGNFSLGSIPNSSLSNSDITINGTAISLGSSGSINTDAVGEGSTNLYFTNARARGAVSAGGDLSYNSSTGVFSFTKPSPVVTVTMTGDVTGSASATLTSLASGTVSIATTIAANSVALGTDTTGNYMVNVTAGTGISVSHTQGEGSTATITNTGVTSLNGDTGAKTLAHYHATFQTVTAAQETSNASSTVTFTFSDLADSVHHMVLLNRIPLRPTEYSVSGSTLTIAAGLGLIEGDEIEVTGSRFTA